MSVFGSHEPPAGLRRLLAPPSAEVTRYALALVGPLAALVVGLKLYKLATVAAPVGFGGVFIGIGADLAFMVLYLAFVMLSLSALRGRLALLVKIPLHLLTLALALVAIIEHGFYTSTGSQLDLDLFGYGIAHFGALRDVYMSEVGLGLWLGLGVIIAVNLLPAALQWRRARRAPADSRPPPAPARWTRRPTSLYASAGALTVVIGLALSSATLPSAAEPLRPNIFLAFAAEGLSGDAEPAPLEPAEAPAELALVDSGKGPRRNVVILVLESTRASATTPYAPELDTTPNLVKLAARGALVDDGYTVMTHTSKALVGILCGIYPKLDTPVDEAGPEGIPATCLPEILAGRGYTSAFFQPATARFERRDQLVKNAGFAEFWPVERLPAEGFDKNNYFGYEDDIMVDPVLRWVDRQDKPFLLTLLTLTSHHKYRTPKGWRRRPYAKGRALNNYLNAVAYTDAFIGKLFEGFEARGMLDDTIFIILGDHGEGFGEHGRYQHDTVIYQEGVQIPFIVLAPEIAPGTHITGLRQSIDILPTVLDLLGVEVTAGLPGVSLRAPAAHERLYLSCWYHNRCMALREGDRKVIYHFGKRPTEVFDLARDPSERDSVARSIDPELVKGWERDLLAWHERANARYADQFRRFKEDVVTTLPPRPTRPMDVTLSAPGGEPLMRIVGVDPTRTTIKEGEPLIATYYFEVLAPLGDKWRIFTHILGTSEGAKAATNADHSPVNGRFPTKDWQAGRFVADLFRFQPKRSLPPGRYEVAIGLWNSEAKGDIEDTRADPSGSGAEIDDERRVHVLSFEVVPAERALILP